MQQHLLRQVYSIQFIDHVTLVSIWKPNSIRQEGNDFLEFIFLFDNISLKYKKKLGGVSDETWKPQPRLVLKYFATKLNVAFSTMHKNIKTIKNLKKILLK